MVNTLIETLLVGSAVFYVIEAVDYFLSIYFEVRRNSLNLILSAPLSAGGMYLFGSWDNSTIITSLSAALIASLIGLMVNRPTVIRQRRNYL